VAPPRPAALVGHDVSLPGEDLGVAEMQLGMNARQPVDLEVLAMDL